VLNGKGQTRWMRELNLRALILMEEADVSAPPASFRDSLPGTRGNLHSQVPEARACERPEATGRHALSGPSATAQEVLSGLLSWRRIPGKPAYLPPR
jgi:hypothetical protein